MASHLFNRAVPIERPYPAPAAEQGKPLLPPLVNCIRDRGLAGGLCRHRLIGLSGHLSALMVPGR